MWAVLPIERHSAIAEAVTSAGVVSTEALVTLLAVSAETVRRDLAVLEERGVIRRVHGGAATAATRGSGEPSFTVRSTSDRDAKATLAHAAVGLLRDGQTVVIDIGTTAVEVEVGQADICCDATGSEKRYVGVQVGEERLRVGVGARKVAPADPTAAHQ